MKRISWGMLAVGVALLVSILGACGGDGGGREGEPAPGSPQGELGFTRATVTVVVPEGVDTTGWTIETGVLSSTPINPTGPQTEINVLEEERQLVWAKVPSGQMVLAAIKEPGERRIPLGAWDTAATVLSMNILLLRDYLADPRSFRERLASFQEAHDLAESIERNLPGAASGIAAVAGYDERVLKTATAVALRLHPEAVASQKVAISPEAERSFVRVEKVGVDTANDLTLKVTNRGFRWVRAFLASKGSKWLGPDVMVKARTLPTSITSAALAALDGFATPSGQLRTNVATLLSDPMEVRVYGPGLKSGDVDFFEDPNWAEVLLPTAITAVDLFILPLIDMIIGGSSFAKDGAAPSRTTALVDLGKIILKSLGIETRQMILEGKWAMALIKMTWAGFKAVATNRDDILLSLLGGMAKQIVLGIVDTLIQSVTGIKAFVLGAKIALHITNLIFSGLDIVEASPLEIFDVEIAPPDLALTAKAVGDPCARPLVGEFTARAGSPIRTWEWDFDGDGKIDRTEESEGEEVRELKRRRTYSQPIRPLYARLKVTDLDGLEAEQTVLFGLFPPRNLKAEAKSSAEIELTWHDCTRGEEGSRIERSTDGAHFTRLAVLAGDTSNGSYRDRSVQPGHTYSYRVRAFIPDADSEWSNVASASTRQEQSLRYVRASSGAIEKPPGIWNVNARLRIYVDGSLVESEDDHVVSFATWARVAPGFHTVTIKLSNVWGERSGVGYEEMTRATFPVRVYSGSPLIHEERISMAKGEEKDITVYVP